MKTYLKTNGYSPSLQEIQKKLKLASVSTAHFHVSKLQNDGYITKQNGKARSIAANNTGKMIRIPLLGYIAAGAPIEAIEDRTETIAIPAEKVPRTGNLFALSVQGDSMTDENINDGDVILVKQQNTANDGDVIVALIENENATVKKFYRERGKIRLQPANKEMDSFFVKPSALTIQGVVIDVIAENPTESETKQVLRPQSKPVLKSAFQIGRERGSAYCEGYLGDSLDVLPQLERKYRTIYLDPPFNSNRDYTYSALGERFGFLDTWKEGEYEHWLDKLIAMCKTKLLPDGTLFFHISAELSLAPHLVLQKHFKKIEPIFWKKAHGKNTVKNKLGAVVDIIYKATDNGSKFNLLHVPLDEYYFEHSYRNKDAHGLYALGSIKHDKTRSGHLYTIKRDGITYCAPHGWKISRERLDELLREDRIHFARPKKGTQEGMLYKKLYKHEVKGKPLSNLWDDIHYITRTTQDERLYPTQKPVALLKR
ncbi:MAG: transcriptional repressor LexA, partial [Candidatus Uhrbacteria bacterium]|nr:transcriptional repressor LexA [Candidatus Uhrbacteria bacterium]